MACRVLKIAWYFVAAFMLLPALPACASSRDAVVLESGALEVAW